jgi:hypothetical protein
MPMTAAPWAKRSVLWKGLSIRQVGDKDDDEWSIDDDWVNADELEDWEDG